MSKVLHYHVANMRSIMEGNRDATMNQMTVTADFYLNLITRHPITD